MFVKFSLKKTFQKPFQNEAQTMNKLMPKTNCFLSSLFFKFWPRFLNLLGPQDGAKSAALLAAPGVLKPTAFMLALTDCFSFLRGGQSGPNSRVNLAVVSTSWLIFHYWPVFDLPWVCLSAFWSFFSRLGTLQPRFWSPSWPYVGTYFALGGIFGHGAGIAAKKTCWHSLSAFRFHNAARRYVRSTWNR